MVARGTTTTTHITHTISVVDVGKMVKLQYEATTNLSLFGTFVAFATFLSHPTIGNEYNQ
jgi:hypothetical protein